MQKNGLVTFVVFAYNQAPFVADAIQSAFAQTHDSIEFLFSDDCSTDETFAIMQNCAEKYDGPHRIRLSRNEQNLGLIGHLNRVFEMADGDLIVVNSGDDISLPHRTVSLHQVFESERPLLIHSDVATISRQGADLGETMSPMPRMLGMTRERAARATALCIGASSAWSRELYELFGPIQEKEAYGDLVNCFRAILADRLSYIGQPLVKYRLGGLSTAPLKRPETRQAYIQKLQKVHKAVYRQRLADCRHFAPERKDLIRLLEALTAAGG